MLPSGSYRIKVTAYKEDDNKCLLGGLVPQQEINFIPSSLNYSYCNLTRKPNLQKPDNYCLKFRSPDAEKIFYRLWDDGDFEVEVNLAEEEEEESTKTSVFAWSLIPFDAGDNEEEYSMRFHQWVFHTTNPNQFEGYRDWYASPHIKSIFTQRQIEALRTRVMHRLFRQCGSLFSEFWRNLILECLSEDCKIRGYWYDMIDINMIMADTAIHCGSALWDFRLFNVGNALETKGKVGLAVQIYEDLLMIQRQPENFPTFPPITNFSEATIHIRLGCLHKCIGNWDSSFRAFVAAMEADCRRRRGKGLEWDLNDSETRALIDSFYLMLLHLANADSGIAKSTSYLRTFAGLLSKAGYKIEGDSIDVSENMQCLFKRCERYISPSIHKEQANHILCMLFQSKNVEDCQTNLIRSEHPDLADCQIPPLPDTTDKKKWKCDARNRPSYLLNNPENNDTAGIPPECDNPLCLEKCLVRSNLKDCSECHNVQYCSKQCQIQHWRVHKKECRRWCKQGPKFVPVDKKRTD